MPNVRKAKLFKNGGSQAVRLPAEFRFEGSEIYIKCDGAIGDVVLSSQPGVKAWDDLFEFMKDIDVPVDFMMGRPMNILPLEQGSVEDTVAQK